MNATGKQTVLYTFTGGTDGATPYAGVVRDKAGNLYGVTVYGGDGSGIYGHGVVFEVDAAGKETALYAFSYPPDGSLPKGRLLLDDGGNLYGTTYLGGIVNNNCPYGCGTVFELSPDHNGNWTETVLCRFTGTPDAASPGSGLVRDAAGDLYGTTLAGGINSTNCSGFGSAGCGTIFKLSAGGQETVLYKFKSLPDGANPWAGLLLNSAKGVLYGTTRFGGINSCSDGFGAGCGTVFEFNPVTGKETELHRFSGGADGANPFGAWYGISVGTSLAPPRKALPVAAPCSDCCPSDGRVQAAEGLSADTTADSFETDGVSSGQPRRNT